MYDDDRTQVTHIFGLRGAECGTATGSLDAEQVLELGRYTIHTDGPRTSGLRVLGGWEIPLTEITFEGEPWDNTHLSPVVSAQVWADTLGHAQLHLLVSSSGGVTELADHLQVWCRRRREMRIQGLTLPAWFIAHVDTRKDAGWDQDVLQVVRLPEKLAVRLSDEMSGGDCVDVIRLVYRNPDSEYSTQGRRLRTPPELNHALGELASHGRGVVVLGGHAHDRNEALTFIGAQLIFALARVRGIRIDVETQLREMQDVGPNPSARWLDWDKIKSLSETVRQMRIRLAVDVEAFADGIYMPEIVLDDFRRSYAGALDLGSVVESTSTMLDSLAEVAEAYRAEAQLLLAGQRQELQRRWQRLATIASAVAIPLTLVFAFFGVSSNVNAPSNTSIFDMAFYWPVWAVAALSVVAILLFTYRTSRPTVLETKS